MNPSAGRGQVRDLVHYPVHYSAREIAPDPIRNSAAAPHPDIPGDPDPAHSRGRVFDLASDFDLAPDMDSSPDSDLVHNLDLGRGPSPAPVRNLDPDRNFDPDRAPDRAFDRAPAPDQSARAGLAADYRRGEADRRRVGCCFRSSMSQRGDA